MRCCQLSVVANVTTLPTLPTVTFTLELEQNISKWRRRVPGWNDTSVRIMCTALTLRHKNPNMVERVPCDSALLCKNERPLHIHWAQWLVLLCPDGSRGGGAAEESAEGERGAGPPGRTGWLGPAQPADGAAEQTGRTESGDDRRPRGNVSPHCQVFRCGGVSFCEHRRFFSTDITFSNSFTSHSRESMKKKTAPWGPQKTKNRPNK